MWLIIKEQFKEKNMNWFSHWDEVLEDKTAVNVDNFEFPTEEEINNLFGQDDKDFKLVIKNDTRNIL